MRPDGKSVTVYVDLMGWQYEIGHRIDGNHIFPTMEALKRYSLCWEECGIAEVEITFKRIVVPQNFYKKVEPSDA